MAGNYTDSQYRVLYRVFLLRIVDLELLSADGDPMRLLGQFAALFAAISFLFCLPLMLLGGYSPELTRSMSHFLIATTMLVTGLLSVLSWDSIFPDRRDVLVLTPLPVAPRFLFAAKLSALGHMLLCAVVALNIFTGLTWPFYFSFTANFIALAHSLAAYWISTLAAGAFMFFFVLTLQGMSSQCLPRQLFLRISAWIQTAAFSLFLGVYVLEPSLESPQMLAATESQRLLPWLPSYWFWGLFEHLYGASESSSTTYAHMAMRAGVALAIVLLGAAITGMYAYRYSLRKIIEEPEILPQHRVLPMPHWFSDSLPGAITLFCLHTLLRSRRHRIILSFYLGVGLAVVLIYANTLLLLQSAQAGTAFTSVKAPLLAANILMMCVSVGGVRVISAIPVDLKANWVFRITQLGPPPEYLRAVRRALLLLSVLPIWLCSALALFCMWPWRDATEHLIVLALLGMTLVEISLLNFQKLPFTCSYLPGKGNLQYVFWACAIVVFPLINSAAQIEMHTLNHPASFGAVLVILGAALAFARSRSASGAELLDQLKFDETEPQQLLALDLNEALK